MQNLVFAGGTGILAFAIIMYLLNFMSRMTRSPSVPRYSGKPAVSNRIAIISGGIVFIAILSAFKNLVPAILAVIIIVLIPSQIVYFTQRKNRKFVLEQSAAAIKMFANEYAISSNIKTSLQAAGNSTTGKVSEIFKYAYYQLSLGRTLEEVLDDMGEQLGTTYGYLFTKLVELASKKGAIILPLLHELVTRIRLAQDQENYKFTQVTTDNLFNLALIVFPVIEYLFLLRIVPDVNTLIFGTKLGMLLFTGWLVSIVVWFVVDRLIEDF